LILRSPEVNEEALCRAERINAMLDQWLLAMTGAQSKVPVALVDLLAENPYWTVKRVAERLGVAFTTAQGAVDRLEQAGILAQTTAAKRDQAYCARAVLEIREEPASLMPAG